MRVAGAGAGSEAEFVRMLRADGVLVRPRFAAGRDDQVVGYSVALAPAAGREPVWHAGGKVAKDLTLPRLRSDGGWTAQDPEAIEEWQRAFRGDPPARPPAPAGDPDIQRTVGELRAVRDAAAGNAAAAARRARPASTGGRGWSPSSRRDWSAARSSCRGPRRHARPRAVPRATRAPSLPLMAAALVNPSNKTLWRLALLQEMSALSSAVAAAHNAAGELQRAERLLAQVRGQLEPLRVGFEDAHAAVDPEYAQAAAQLPCQPGGTRLNEIATGGGPAAAGPQRPGPRRRSRGRLTGGPPHNNRARRR